MITVMIPTKGRPEKLLTCVKSIPDWVGVIIVATQESDVPQDVRDIERFYLHIKIDASLNVPKAFNYMVNECNGDIVMSSDDVEYEDGAFNAVKNMFAIHGHDIVVGMHVTNMICNDDAFQAVGYEFKDNHKPLYCEEYEHFYIDTEVGDIAKAEGKFLLCPAAKLKNFHPMSGCLPDATHSHRHNEKLTHDAEVYRNRAGRGFRIPQEAV